MLSSIKSAPSSLYASSRASNSARSSSGKTSPSCPTSASIILDIIGSLLRTRSHSQRSQNRYSRAWRRGHDEYACGLQVGACLNPLPGAVSRLGQQTVHSQSFRIAPFWSTFATPQMRISSWVPRNLLWASRRIVLCHREEQRKCEGPIKSQTERCIETPSEKCQHQQHPHRATLLIATRRCSKCHTGISPN